MTDIILVIGSDQNLLRKVDTRPSYGIEDLKALQAGNLLKMKDKDEDDDISLVDQKFERGPGIPDAKTIFEIKKKRELMRNSANPDFLPLMVSQFFSFRKPLVFYLFTLLDGIRQERGRRRRRRRRQI
jgi:hypothetical protein